MSFLPTESLYSKIEKLYTKKHNCKIMHLFNISLMYLSTRSFLMYHFMKFEPVQNYLNFDHVCTIFYNGGLKQREFYLVFSPLFLFFVFTLNHIISIDNCSMWRVIHFAIQETVGGFFRANSNTLFFKKTKLFNLKNKIWKEIVNVFHMLILKPNSVKFVAQKNVQLSQTISKKFKCKIVLFWIFLEVITQILIILCKYIYNNKRALLLNFICNKTNFFSLHFLNSVIFPVGQYPFYTSQQHHILCRHLFWHLFLFH